MDILCGHFGVDETWVGGIGKDVWVGLGEMVCKVASIEDASKLGPSILSVGAKILVELIQRCELAVGWSSLVGVG